MGTPNSDAVAIGIIKSLAVKLGLLAALVEGLETAVREREDKDIEMLEAAIEAIKPQFEHLTASHDGTEDHFVVIARGENGHALLIEQNGDLSDDLEGGIGPPSAVRNFGLERILEGIRELLEAKIDEMGNRRAQLEERLRQPGEIEEAEKARRS